MRKLILLVFILITILGCNRPQNRSIFEQLALKDLNSIIEKDTSFQYTYRYIVYTRDSILKTDADRIKWLDLTYSRIHKYNKLAADTSYFKQFKYKFQGDWQKKYSFYLLKVDSVLDYWGKYRKENSLENYVRIELADIKKNYYDFLGNLESISLGFRLTPLKGTIEQLSFSYKIESIMPSEKIEVDSSISSVHSGSAMSWCLSTTPFSKPIVKYWKVNDKYEALLKERDLQFVLKNYNIVTEVEKIKVGAKNISIADLHIPGSIVEFGHLKPDSILPGLKNDYHREEIIKELLYTYYVGESEYVDRKIDSILKRKDPLSHDFMNLLSTDRSGELY